MCELYVRQGVTTVVATPHMCDGHFDVPAAAVRRGVEALSNACRQQALDLRILPGGDVRLQPELLQALDSGEALTLADTGKYLLLELPDLTVRGLEGLVFALQVRGVTPILSHPERNDSLCRSPELLNELMERGCLVQVIAGALLGEFGRRARRCSEKLLRSGRVHVVASDAHSARRRRPELDCAAGLIAGMAGAETARRLLRENPVRIIHGVPLRTGSDVWTEETMRPRVGTEAS